MAQRNGFWRGHVVHGAPGVARMAGGLVAALAVVLAALLAGPAARAGSPGVTVLHSFNYADGMYPQGRLLYGSDGRIYGSTYAGGLTGLGTVFAVSTAKQHTILHSFDGSDGNSLDSGLLQRADGTLVGSTPQGSISVGGISTNFGGSVFQLQPDGSSFSSLRKFNGNGLPDGAQPGTLVDGGDGFFYGTMRSGGAGGAGTVFKMSADGALATLYGFNGSTGAYPGGLLTLGSDGMLYGSLRYGPGNNDKGALFRLSRDGGAYTLLHNFNGSDGASPSAALLELDGAFYGVTGSGGSAGYGTVFRMTPAGAITTLHAFNGVDGASPVGPLVKTGDGNLVGLSFGGGTSGGGTIFRISPGGSFMTLHLLQAANGTKPVVGPVLGADGLLYGSSTQYGGGTGAAGSVFQFDPLMPQPAVLAMSKTCYNEFNICFTPINTWVGQRYTVSWSSANLASCVASGAWTGAKPGGGRLDVTPTRAGIYTYRLRCSGASGPKASAVVVTVG